MQSKDEFYIKRCLQIAKNGLFTAKPNPSVGAVIVVDDKIIGEGFTSAYGGPHAEVNAVNSVVDKTLLKQATIYVTLEPCSHFGKTPPCADLIVKHQFKRAVIGCVDSNSLVAGKGIERLQKANIDVKVGVLEKECFTNHKRFFTFQNKKRPYIILKWAQTKDGFIAPLTKDINRPVWISNEYSKQLVHKLRAKEQAILVGTNTVLADNPKLNVRSWFGQNPIRIVIDRNLRIPENASVFDGSVKTIIFTEEGKEKIEKRKLDFQLDKSREQYQFEASREKCQFERSRELVFETVTFSSLGKLKGASVCAILYKHNIQSVIIEGGTKILQTFIDENLWDEANVFIGENSFNKGVEAPNFEFASHHQQKIKNDTLKIYYND